MDKKSIEITKKFAKRIKNRFNIKKFILFGSRARGDNFVNSDFDFVIVSPDFENVFFTKRISQMYPFWKDYPLEVEPLCYTPEEFEKKKKFGIIKQAIKEGIEIK